MNLADSSTFTRPIIKALRSHANAIAQSMAGPKGSPAAIERALPAAGCWVYLSAVVAWAEDHGLIDPWLRPGATELRETWLTAGGDMRSWLGVAFTSLAVHPATRCLVDPRYAPLQDRDPGEPELQALVDWWGKAPSLAYETDSGPASVSGWIIGDLLQYLRDPRPDGGGGGNAQTPWWVADFILDRTLVPAVETFPLETLRTIDPACGTGHFLIRKIDYLWQWYTTGTLASRQVKRPPLTGGKVRAPMDAIKMILAGVDGCEIDPLTAAVARLRMVVAIGQLLHRSGLISSPRLDAIPAWVTPRVAVGDSLLAGKVSQTEYEALHPELAAIENLGVPEQVHPPAPTFQQDSLFDEANA
jgi:hypothetical protein